MWTQKVNTPLNRAFNRTPDVSTESFPLISVSKPILPLNLFINFLFGISLSFSSIIEQRVSTLLNAVNGEPKNFRPTLLFTYQRLFESHKYCGHGLFIMTICNAKIPDVYSKCPQTQVFLRGEVALLLQELVKSIEAGGGSGEEVIPSNR